MFKVLLKGRLFAAITAGVVISAGVIALGGGPILSNSNSTSGASFRIGGVIFAASGFNTSSCSLLNGVVLLKIEGLSGDQKLTSVNLSGQRIALENTYTHAGETTIVLLDYPWLQGYKYHVTVTSESQTTVEVDSPISPVITPINVTIKSLSINGSSVRLSVANQSKCNAYLTGVLVSGLSIPDETNIIDTPQAVQSQNSSSFILTLPFTPQVGARYVFTLIIGGSVLTYSLIAYPIHGGGSLTTRPN